jgi:hypothetical protein
MTAPYTYTTTLSWGGDEPTAELEVECTYSVAWGSPETGRGYMADPELYDPGSPDIVEDIRIVSVNGKPWRVDLVRGFLAKRQDHKMLVEKLMNDCEEDMLRNAREIEQNRSGQ